MRGSLSLPLVLALASSACVTARGRADQAYSRADFVAAADQYEALAAQSPEDAELRERRDEARTRALVTLAARTRNARLSGRGEDELTALADLLARDQAWPGAAGTWTAQTIDEESAAGAAYVERQIQGLVAD